MKRHSFRIVTGKLQIARANFHTRKLRETAVFYAVCVKSKVTLLNIVIRGGSGSPAISKMEHSVAIPLH